MTSLAWRVVLAACLAAPALAAGADAPPAAPAPAPATTPAAPAAPGAKPAEGKVVYATDFRKPVGGEWSRPQIETAPNGQRKFLGQFGAEDVRLTLQDLPDHAWARVSFDLLIINSWDGGHTTYGPDRWWLAVEKGPKLIHATFSRAADQPELNQSFPDMFSYGSHPGRTGADETNSLGFSEDSLYRLSAVFPHTEKTLALHFAGDNLQPLDDESWGLGGVQVEVFSAAPGAGLTDEQLKRLTRVLAGKDSVAAHKALWELVGAGERAVPLLKACALSQFAAEKPPDNAQMRQWIAQLDDNAWAVREAATQKLKEQLSDAEPLLRETLAGPCSAEVRSRLEMILQPAGQALRPDGDPRARAAWVLGVIGGPEALEFLKQFTRECPNPSLRSLSSQLTRRLLSPPKAEPRPRPWQGDADEVIINGGIIIQGGTLILN